jgi:histidyl-tRNA synthetase
MGGRNRSDIARRLLQKRHRLADRQQVATALGFLETWLVNASVAEAFSQLQTLDYAENREPKHILTTWHDTIKSLEAYEIDLGKVRIQSGLLRDWDYYTGIVFEAKLNTNTHIGGGGRYDELISLIGGAKAVPAVGFAYSLDALLSDISTSRLNCIALIANTDNSYLTAKWAHQLRNRGLYLELHYEIASGLNAIWITDDGNARYAGRVYTLDEIDTLANVLQGRSGEL